MADVKRSTWELYLKDGVSNGLSALEGAGHKIEKSFQGVQHKIHSVEEAFHHATGEMANEIPGLSKAMEMLTSPAMLAGGAIAAVGIGLFKAGEKALEWEDGMAKINGTAQLGEETLGKLSDRLQEIGSHSGGNFDKIPAAFELIEKQTHNVNKSLDILEVSTMGAQAGFTDLNALGDSTAKVMSSIADKTVTAKAVMDEFFAIRKIGGGDIGAIAAEMPHLIADAHAVGVSYKEAGGVLGFLMGKGFDVQEASGKMKQVWNAFGKSAVALKEKGGVSMFNTDGSKKDMNEFFGELKKKTENLTDEGKANFYNLMHLDDPRARTAIDLLTGDIKGLKLAEDAVAHSAGAMNKAFEASGSVGRTWENIKDEWKSIETSIGTALLPAIGGFTDIIKSDMESIIKLFHWKDTKKEISEDVNLRRLANFRALEAVNRNYGMALKAHGGRYNNEEMWYLKAFSDQYVKSYKEQNSGNKNHIVDTIPKAVGGNTDKKTTKDSAADTAMEEITTGGKSVRNVTVNIGKLVEHFEVKSTNLEEGAGEIKRMMEETLLRAIQGSEIALSNE